MLVFRQDVPDLLEKDGDFLLRKEQIKKGMPPGGISLRFRQRSFRAANGGTVGAM